MIGRKDNVDNMERISGKDSIEHVVSSTKYPLSEVAEAIEAVLKENIDVLELKNIARESLYLQKLESYYMIGEEASLDQVKDEVNKIPEGDIIETYLKTREAYMDDYVLPWPELLPEFIQIAQKGENIGDIPLGKGEKYLSFNGYANENLLVNIHTVAKYLPQEMRESLVIYHRPLMPSIASNSIDLVSFKTVDAMIEGLKKIEAVDKKKDIILTNEKKFFGRRKENQNREKRSSIRNKLEKNKESLQKNIQKNKEQKDIMR